MPRVNSDFYMFNEEDDGTFTDDCGNTYTAEEFEALTCNTVVFSGLPPDENNLLQIRSLKHLYDKERLRFGLKPPFGDMTEEEIARIINLDKGVDEEWP